MTKGKRRRRVLIVEDEPALRLSYERAFHPRYDLVFASTGAEALELPVIITTAYMSIEPQLKVLDLPHSGYIVKPFRLDELGARIDAVT